jgi:TolB protein
MNAMNRCQSPFRLIFPLALFFLLLSSLPALAQRIQLDIASSGVRKVMVAVPNFVDGSGNANSVQGKKIADLLIQGLEFHGFVEVVKQDRPGADWRSLGVDYVVLGKYSTQGSQMTLEGSLLEVTSERMLAGKQFRGPADQQDDMTLRLVDSLIESFSGEPGISRTSIAFVSDGTGRKEIYMGDVLGRNVRQITRHNHLCVAPRFTADGKHLAYSSYHRGNQNLYITDLGQDRVTHALSRREGLNMTPAFSPDNKNMVVTLSHNGTPDLYLTDIKGQIIEQLTENAGINVSPSYSPDGKSIVFVSDRSGRPQIYLMDIKTKKTRLLTFQGRENVEPSWSPKGDQIVYTSRVAGSYHIFTLPVQGGSPTQITSGYGNYESPSWSPDGRQIAYSRNRNGRVDICAIFAHGQGERRLFTVKGNQSYPRWSPHRN